MRFNPKLSTQHQAFIGLDLVNTPDDGLNDMELTITGQLDTLIFTGSNAHTILNASAANAYAEVANHIAITGSDRQVTDSDIGNPLYLKRVKGKAIIGGHKVCVNSAGVSGSSNSIDLRYTRNGKSLFEGVLSIWVARSAPQPAHLCINELPLGCFGA